jgi:hypothetical protein
VKSTYLIAVALAVGVVAHGQTGEIRMYGLHLESQEGVAVPMVDAAGVPVAYLGSRLKRSQDVWLAGRVMDTAGAIVRLTDAKQLAITLDGQQLGDAAVQQGTVVEFQRGCLSTDKVSVALIVEASPAMARAMGGILSCLDARLAGLDAEYSVVWSGSGFAKADVSGPLPTWDQARQALAKMPNEYDAELPVHLPEAVASGLQQLRQRKGSSRRCVLLITDGQGFAERQKDVTRVLQPSPDTAGDRDIAVFVMPVGFQGQVKPELTAWLETASRRDDMLPVQEFDTGQAVAAFLAPDFTAHLSFANTSQLRMDGREHEILLSANTPQRVVHGAPLRFHTTSDRLLLVILLGGGIAVLFAIALGMLLLVRRSGKGVTDISQIVS